jgi:hypothetical protein
VTHGINKPRFPCERPPRPLPRTHARREKNPSKKRHASRRVSGLPLHQSLSRGARIDYSGPSTGARFCALRVLETRAKILLGSLGRWNQRLKGELEPKVQLGPGAKLVSELLTMNSGIAAGTKHLQPRIRVVGVQAELAPAYYLS